MVVSSTPTMAAVDAVALIVFPCLTVRQSKINIKYRYNFVV